MKTLGLVLRAVAILAVLVVLGLLVLAAFGYRRVHRTVNRRVPLVEVSTDSAHIARGRHLASIGCVGCHSALHPDSLVLTGSTFNFAHESGSPDMGELWAPNLTPGGRLKEYSDGELARGIREGLDRNGRPLLLMPSVDFRGMSDEDLGALIAYLRSQPAVTRNVPARRLNIIPYILIGAHVFNPSDQPAIQGAVIAPPADSTADYGEYLVALGGCRGCHGPTLQGQGDIPNAWAVAHDQSLETFTRAVRGGISPRGNALDPTKMPWPNYARYSDVEIHAIYVFVRGLTAPVTP